MTKFPIRRSCDKDELKRLEYFKHIFQEYLGEGKVNEWIHCFNYPITQMTFDFRVSGARSLSSISVKENLGISEVEGEVAVPKKRSKQVEKEINDIRSSGMWAGVTARPCTVTEKHEHFEDTHIHFVCKPLAYELDEVIKKLLEILANV